MSEPEDPNEKGVQTDRRITGKKSLNFLSSDEELERRIHNQISKVRSMSRDKQPTLKKLLSPS